VYTVVVTGGTVSVTVGAVVVRVEITVRELLAKYPAAPDTITRIMRMTIQLACPKADIFDKTIELFIKPRLYA